MSVRDAGTGVHVAWNPCSRCFGMDVHLRLESAFTMPRNTQSNGLRHYEGRPQTRLRLALPDPPLVLGFIVPSEAPQRTLEDLKGLSVPFTLVRLRSGGGRTSRRRLHRLLVSEDCLRDHLPDARARRDIDDGDPCDRCRGGSHCGKRGIHRARLHLVASASAARRGQPFLVSRGGCAHQHRARDGPSRHCNLLHASRAHRGRARGVRDPPDRSALLHLLFRDFSFIIPPGASPRSPQRASRAPDPCGRRGRRSGLASPPSSCRLSS